MQGSRNFLRPAPDSRTSSPNSRKGNQCLCAREHVPFARLRIAALLQVLLSFPAPYAGCYSGASADSGDFSLTIAAPTRSASATIVIVGLYPDDVGNSEPSEV